jgi:hypothetical protein
LKFAVTHLRDMRSLIGCALSVWMVSRAFAAPVGLVPGTVVGVPEVQGGPTCCMFDSPYLGVALSPSAVAAYTANSNTYLYALGPTVDSLLPSPAPVGLGPDPDVTSYSHCGKWLNAAWVDGAGLVHGYFHQEWHCDYADGDYSA